MRPPVDSNDAARFDIESYLLSNFMHDLVIGNLVGADTTSRQSPLAGLIPGQQQVTTSGKYASGYRRKHDQIVPDPLAKPHQIFRSWNVKHLTLLPL